MSRNVIRSFLTLSLCVLITAGSLSGYYATRSDSSGRAHGAGDLVKEIAGYRSWTRVNTEPQLMPEQAALLCAAPIPLKAHDSTNPHRRKYVTVYVNEAGRRAMIEQRHPAFPEGSVIVKEKLPDRLSSAPELLTVMIKRGKGFNPSSGDWEYMVVDGTGSDVSAQGKLENCQSCHSAKPDTDYIFRTYLSPAMRSKLK